MRCILRTKTLTKGWHLIFSLDDLITVPLARFRQGTKAVFLVQLFINHLSAYVFVNFCPKLFYVSQLLKVVGP